MAVSFCYSVDDVIAAISNADSYRNKAADTGQFIFVDTVIDAELALKRAGLTNAQREILYYRWTLGFTQEETALILGKKRDSIAKAEERSRCKVRLLLDTWEDVENV